MIRRNPRNETTKSLSQYMVSRIVFSARFINKLEGEQFQAPISRNGYIV